MPRRSKGGAAATKDPQTPTETTTTTDVAEMTDEADDATTTTDVAEMTDEADAQAESAPTMTVSIEVPTYTMPPAALHGRLPGHGRKKRKKAPAALVRQAQAILQNPKGVLVHFPAPWNALKWHVRVHKTSVLVDIQNRNTRIEREAASLSRFAKANEQTPLAIQEKATARTLIDLTCNLAGPIDDFDDNGKLVVRDFDGVSFYDPHGKPINPDETAQLYNILVSCDDLRIKMDQALVKLRETLQTSPEDILPLASGQAFSFATGDSSED